MTSTYVPAEASETGRLRPVRTGLPGGFVAYETGFLGYDSAVPRPSSSDPVLQRKIGLTGAAWAAVDAAAKRSGLSAHDWVRDAVLRKLTSGGTALDPAGVAVDLGTVERRRREAYADPRTCTHPVNRRAGGRCLVCGSERRK